MILKSEQQAFFSFKNIVGFIISITCVIWSFKNFDLSEFIKHIQSVNYYLFIIAVVILIFSVIIRSIRWSIFFKEEEIKYLSLFSLFKNEMIGYFGNNIFPFKLGDLLRIFILSKETKLSKSYLIGSVALERIIDMASLFLFLFIFFFISYLNNFSISNVLFENYFFDYSYILIYLALLLFILLVCFFIIRKNKILFDWDLFFLSFNNIKNYKKVSRIIILSLIIWLIYLLNIYIISYSCGYNLSISDSLLLLTFTTLVMVIPSAPGMIGTFHMSVIIIMTKMLNYSIQEASSFSIILHAYSYITYSVIGGYFFIKSNIKYNFKYPNQK